MAMNGRRELRWARDSGTEYVGVLAGLVVLVPYASPTPASLESLSETIERMATDDQAVSLLTVFSTRPILPPAATRSAIQAMLQRVRPLLHATAVVVPGEGFGAAAQRGAATAVFGFARLSHLRVCATPAEGLRWVLDKAALSMDESQVLRAIADQMSVAAEAVEVA